jgi:hypothetical protein
MSHPVLQLQPNVILIPVGSRRAVTAAIGIAGLASSLFVISCGGSKAVNPVTPPPAVGVSANLITNHDVAAAGSGTPEQEILTWAQAIQFLDPRTVLQTYTPAAVKAVGADAITRAVLNIGPVFGRPVFLNATTESRYDVRVRAFLVSYNAQQQPILRQPVTFWLHRQANGWRLADAQLLLKTSRDKDQLTRKAS